MVLSVIRDGFVWCTSDQLTSLFYHANAVDVFYNLFFPCHLRPLTSWPIDFDAFFSLAEKCVVSSLAKHQISSKKLGSTDAFLGTRVCLELVVRNAYGWYGAFSICLRRCQQVSGRQNDHRSYALVSARQMLNDNWREKG